MLADLLCVQHWHEGVVLAEADIVTVKVGQDVPYLGAAGVTAAVTNVTEVGLQVHVTEIYHADC